MTALTTICTPVCSSQVIFASHTVCIRCQVCQPALDLCPDCHACDLQLGSHAPSHPYVVVDSAEFPVLRSEWTARYDRAGAEIEVEIWSLAKLHPVGL